jgi:VWFA-related protein
MFRTRSTLVFVLASILAPMKAPVPALLSGLLSTPLSAQTAADATTTIKSKAHLVLVDVVVANEQGDPIAGLKKTDFEVLEDGKPQTLANFEEHRGVPMTQLQLPPMPRGVYTNFPVVQTADSVNIILLDALNTPNRDQAYVRAQMLKYLKTIPPNTRVAIFTLASQLRMLQGVTTDSSELLAALNLTKGAQQSPLLASDAENDANDHFVAFLEQEEQGPGPQNSAQAVVDPIMVAKQFLADTAAFQTEQRLGITLEAFQEMARYLAGVPGRKNLIWFSGSFPTAIFADPDLPDSFNIAHNFEAEIRKTTDMLADAQLAVYPIAAEGLVGDLVYEANGEEIGQKRPSIAMRDQVKKMQKGETSRDLNHSAMQDVAEDTGGHAYYNTNDLSAALARVVSNGSHFYSISYVPTNATMDGKFRRIQVKLTNGKGSLSYRRGYYADETSSALAAGQKPESDPLVPLIARNLPDYSQILYKVLVQPLNPQPPADAAHVGSNAGLKGPFTRYGVDFAISMRDLKLDPGADGSRHGNIEIALAAYDRGGKPVNLVITKGDVHLDSKEAQQSGLQIHKEIDVPKGYVFLRTGVYDLKAATVGTLGMPLIDAVAKVAK